MPTRRQRSITMNTQMSNLNAGDEQRIIRCAIYARYSCEEQREASIEDQIRNCRAAAERNGWVVVEEYIRFDAAMTGRTTAGREGLANLIRLAKQHPKPFDCILIDDTSRLGRYLPDVLRECDRLMHHGVFLYFASDRLDSREPSFRIMHIFKGFRDEDFVRDLGNKIHRGQEGRILKGYVAGNTCYGYQNVPILEETRKGSFGRPALIGVKQEIIPAQAEVVRQIMQMRTEGLSFGRIAQRLIAELVAPPRNPNKAVIPAWYPSTIKQITNNELYRGWRVWNRKQNVFNQAEGKKSRRNRATSEWIRVEVPELRIISDELWDKVQAMNRQRGDSYAKQRLGGLNRSEFSRAYLFSGVLYCGICGSPYSVICGKAPNVRYGCPNYRFRKTCTNRVTILRKRLEQQLIAALSRNLLRPELEDDIARQFSEQLKAAVENEARLANEAVSNGPRLREQRSELQRQAANVVDAIRQHGISPFLSTELATLESSLAEIDRQLVAKPVPRPRAFSEDQIREFLQRASQQFCEVRTSDPERGKQEIQKRITKLVLTPMETPEGRRLEVTGDVALFVGDGVMENSSLEGIAQQYTASRMALANIILDPSLPAEA